jgi:hypothetical protein
LLDQVPCFPSLECFLQSILASLSCTKTVYDILEVANTGHSELKNMFKIRKNFYDSFSIFNKSIFSNSFSSLVILSQATSQNFPRFSSNLQKSFVIKKEVIDAT